MPKVMAATSRSRVRWVAGLGACSVMVFASWLVGVWGGQFVTKIVDDVGLLGGAMVAAGCGVLAAGRSHGRQRLMWWALTTGLGSWSVGEGVWCWYELGQHRSQAPFPSLADAGFLLFPLAGAVGLAVLPGRDGRHARTRLLDGLVVTGSMFVVSWITVLGPVYQAGADGPLALVVSLAYPVGDLVLVTMMVLVLTEAATGHRTTLAFVTGAVALMTVSDSLFAYLTATNVYRTGSLIDVGWLGAFVLFASAAVSATTAPTDHYPERRSQGNRVWLPYVPVVVAVAVGLPRALPTLGSGPVPGVALAVVTVVLVRQFLTMAENRRLLVTVEHQAFHDPLTGLANRALFTDRLDHALGLHQRDLRTIAVACIDLDDFKLVNDTMGHSVGDELLVRVAERLVGCLRAGDTVARLGGDEFAVLIEDGAERPLLAANRILEAFTPPFRVDGHTIAVRPSIGLAIATAATPALNTRTLLKDADTAMYAAKRAGHGGAHLYQPDTPLARPNLDHPTRMV